MLFSNQYKSFGVHFLSVANNTPPWPRQNLLLLCKLHIINPMYFLYFIWLYGHAGKILTRITNWVPTHFEADCAFFKFNGILCRIFVIKFRFFLSSPWRPRETRRAIYRKLNLRAHLLLYKRCLLNGCAISRKSDSIRSGGLGKLYISRMILHRN